MRIIIPNSITAFQYPIPVAKLTDFFMGKNGEMFFGDSQNTRDTGISNTHGVFKQL